MRSFEGFGTAGSFRRVTVSDDIEDRENLGRRVFSKSRRDRARRGRIRFDVFLEQAGTTLFSVDRLDLSSPSEATAIADRAAKARGQPFHGWAVVTAQQAGANGRRVEASPQLDNPYHADVFLPDAVKEDLEKQKSHAQELADNSTWQERA